MNIIFVILIGLVVGVIAKFLMGGGPGGMIMTILLGIAGAVVASFIGQAVGWYAYGQPAGFIASVLGAMLLLFIYHLIATASRPPKH